MRRTRGGAPADKDSDSGCREDWVSRAMVCAPHTFLVDVVPDST